MRSDITRILDRSIIDAGIARAACAAYCKLGSSRVLGAAGVAQEDSIFDLASLTKPCTALLTVALATQGVLDLNAPLRSFLPELGRVSAGEKTLEQHLSHRANMQAHIELFLGTQAGDAVDQASLLQRIARASRMPTGVRTDSNGSDAVYSDLGYLLVGFAIEKVCATPLDEVMELELMRPLGLHLNSARGWRRSSNDFCRRVLPSEDIPERGGEVRGTVHDDNAWAVTGSGLAGHAGLFGTAGDVLELATLLTQAARREGPLRELAAPLLARRNDDSSLRMGLDGVSPTGSRAGADAEQDTFGHLGFTGTSFWCDPDAGLATILLTNRTYPSRHRPSGIRLARPFVHDQLRRLSGG